VTYPNQYAPQQVPGYPQAPDQAQQQFQAPAQPGYPPQQYAAPQGYAPAPGYVAPPQQFAAPQYGQPQQPAPQLAAGSLDAFYSQPSVGGGAALNFPVGTTHVGIVSRPITNADIQQQTNRGTGLPATFKDGRPKFVMKVPLVVTPSQNHPDGIAQWYCAGAARDELIRAMAEAGAPEGPPEAGAALEITCTGERPVQGMNPAKTYRVRYTRPQGAAQASVAQASPQQVSAPPVQQAPIQYAQQTAPVMSTATGQPVVHQQAVPAPPQVQQPMPPAPAAAPAGAPLSAEQQALLAQLTGQTAG
jgi:hypothetical protein